VSQICHIKTTNPLQVFDLQWVVLLV